MERKKKDSEKSLEYLYGYRDALEDVWEEVLKMATKGYNSQEMQIFVKSKSYASKKKLDEEIAGVEAAQKPAASEPEAPPSMLAVAEPEIELVKDLKPGLSYLVKEAKPERIFRIFERQIKNQKSGLCIIRKSPMEVKEKYDLGMSKIIWLTRSQKTPDDLPPSAIGLGLGSATDDLEEEYIDPSNLPKLFQEIVNFLDGHEGGILMLEGVEYMFSHNKPSSVLNFIQKMNEHVVTSRTNLVMALHPQALEPKEFSQIEREMSDTL